MVPGATGTVRDVGGHWTSRESPDFLRQNRRRNQGPHSSFVIDPVDDLTSRGFGIRLPSHGCVVGDAADSDWPFARWFQICGAQAGDARELAECAEEGRRHERRLVADPLDPIDRRQEGREVSALIPRRPGLFILHATRHGPALRSWNSA